MALYDKIGQTYAQTRNSDPRIAAKLLEILKPYRASTIVDIGAGTGSYALVLAEQGYRVLAVEPSTIMRSQAVVHPAIEWLDGSAEHLPLADKSADVAIMMLAFHHFANPQQALYEIARVTGTKALVLFTYDPQMITEFWLTEYFPSLIADVEATFLPITTLTQKIESIMGTRVNVIPFPLPHDLVDSFAAVGWSRPELYLDHTICQGISSFAKMSADELEQGLTRLHQDLDSGLWHQNHGNLGDLLQQTSRDLGYRFVYTQSEPSAQTVAIPNSKFLGAETIALP